MGTALRVEFQIARANLPGITASRLQTIQSDARDAKWRAGRWWHPARQKQNLRPV